jgi:beta-glucosidase/6-phospho-beta-glucosidase/beta-galactosidase
LFGQRVLKEHVLRSDLDWEIYPQGLYRTLLRLRRERLPVLVLENGIADRSDALRPDFVINHARAMLRAIDAGVPLKGYFHWTCFDNFEWAEGYSAQFGLLANDRLTQKRSLRPSAGVFAELCRTGIVPITAGPPPEPAARTEAGGPPDLR